MPSLLKTNYRLPVLFSLAVFFILGNISSGQTSTEKQKTATTKKPNIVFIMADDLGWGELGCYGQKKIPTPNIDALAKSGTRFTAHYSGAPVCAPSRCVLMTGMHLGHATIRGNRPAHKSFPKMTEGQHPIHNADLTIAEILQKAGYKTGAFGKWGLGPVGSTGDPNSQGFDTFYGYNCQRVAHSYFPPHLWHNNQKVTINQNPIPGHQKDKKKQGEVKLMDYQGEVYAPTKIISQAESFIEENKDQPFFLYLPVIEPHVAMHPLPESLNQFPKDWDKEQYLGDSGYLPHPRPHAGYAAMIFDVDLYVGKVMKALEKAGVAENTIVIFTSDNGTTHRGRGKFNIGGCDSDFFNSTRNLRGFKGSVYEGGIRVPMIVRYPGKVAAGKVDKTPSYFADWLPTLCAATGVPTPERNIDGENIWPSITGQKKMDRKKPMVWAFAGYGGQVAIRMGNFKAVRRNVSRKNQPSEWELYDLSKDIGEKKNIAGKFPKIVQKAVATAKAEIVENKLFPVKIQHEE